MKKLFFLASAVFFAASALLSAQTQDVKRNPEIVSAENTALKTGDRVRAFVRYGNAVAGNRGIKKDELYRLADLLVQCPDLTGNDFASIQSIVRRAADNENNQEKRIASAESVIASEKTSADAKNAAVRDQTEALIILGRTDDAFTAAKKALEFPGLAGNALYNAYGNYGHVYSMTGDLKEAVAIYREIGQKDSSPAGLRAMNALIASEYLYFKEYDKAVQVWRDAGDSLREAECLKEIERFSEARAAAERVLKDASAPERDRVTALSFFFSRDPGTREVRKKYPELAAKIDAGFLYWRELRSALQTGAYDYALEVADLLLSNPRVSWRFEISCMKAIALSALNRAEEAGLFAEQALSTHPEFSPEQKFRLRLIAEMLKKPYKENSVKSIFEAAEKEFAESKLTMTQKSAALQYAGRTCAVNAGLDSAVRDVETFYNSLFVPRPENVYSVPFSAEPLRGYADWTHMKNKPAPQLLSWKYGGGMDFLVTDVSTGGRGGGIGTEQNKTQMKYTELSSVCDENGVHFILRAWDDRAAEIEAGTLGGGCYEIYLAPGENEPYHCLLPEIGTASKKLSPWYTTYPNEKARRLPKDLPVETVFHKDGYTMFFTIPWDTFYDKLPDTPDHHWEAEFVQWGRTGGYSWNALESIHSRSTWGKLSFQIPGDGLRKIYRNQIRQAWKKYQAEKNLNVNGVLALWQDPVLGDPEFYEKRVQPLERELDACGEKINTAGEMPQEILEDLWTSAVPRWNEIVYRVADLRRAWLEDQFFNETGRNK